MKRFLKFVGILAGLAILTVVIIALLTPWMDRWGATDEEIAAAFPGDELVPVPASFVNRAITIDAAPEYIYPWIVQLDATKGGWYSYTWLESLLNCPMVNADRIHPEWQSLQIGDEVKMCVSDFAPPPYIVAQIYPNRAIVMGHQDNGEWVDLYQFVIVPQADGTSRLILRTRTMMVGGFWTVMHPGAFIMERGMLYGIKERAELLARTGSLPPSAKTPDITLISLTAMPPTSAGTEVTFGPLSLVLPPGVADGASGSDYPRVDGSDVAWWQKTPGHLQVTLDDYYALQGKSRQPQIYVYPASDYAELLPAAFEGIHRLDNILYGPAASVSADQLPAIPFLNEKQVFASNIQLISFQNGQGVRFLTEYAQYPASANNSDLFYEFQGLTRDGAYYIVAILPITMPKLADTSDGGAPLPPGGVPYPYFAEGANADMKGYYQNVTTMLNNAAPESFTPTIDQLDALVQSMMIAP